VLTGLIAWQCGFIPGVGPSGSSPTQPEDETNRKKCINDDDCIVFGETGDCNCGCFNKDYQWQPEGECFCAAPISCECVNGKCEEVFEKEPFHGEHPEKEQACMNFGGTVSTAMCCKSTEDFPNSCLIGPCGCSPENSHEVKICDCGFDKCFDGSECVSLEPEMGIEWFQTGNTQPITRLQHKQSSELEDNRIGIHFSDLWKLEPEVFPKEVLNASHILNQGVKRARFAINNLDSDRVHWSKPENTIDPSHDDFIFFFNSS
ncbi:unnamed protein product, partial [marine sediment metagenome]